MFPIHRGQPVREITYLGPTVLFSHEELGSAIQSLQTTKLMAPTNRVLMASLPFEAAFQGEPDNSLITLA